MSIAKIYILSEPDGQIRYVGKTVISINKRFYSHLRDAKLGIKNHRCNWIRYLANKGKLPSVQLLGEVDGDGSKEEIAWIAYLRQEGYNLVNETLGGEGMIGRNHTEEAKRKISIAVRKNPTRYWLGKKRDARTCLAISRAHIGKKISKETRIKMGIARRGKKHTEEAKGKMSKSRKGLTVSIATRKKISLSKIGCTSWSKGKKLSQERIDQIRQTNTGRKHSREECAKMSLAVKEWWKKRKSL